MQKKLKRAEEDLGVEDPCRRNSKEAKKIWGRKIRAEETEKS